MSDAGETVNAASRDVSGSADRFGWEWATYAEILPEYEEQFRRWTVHLRPEDWRGKSFLDVGCGMGRNSYWPMKYGAREGVAVDIDDRSLAVREPVRYRLLDWRDPSCGVSGESAGAHGARGAAGWTGDDLGLWDREQPLARVVSRSRAQGAV